MFFKMNTRHQAHKPAKSATNGTDFRNGMVRGSDYVSVPNLVEIGQTAADIMAIFRFFQDGGRPSSWICCACVGTTHGGHLVVFIAVQNLVGIGAVVLIMCTFFDFASLA